MAVLVTGGAGFIGSHMVDRLIDEGMDVVVVDNISRGRLEYVNPRAKFYEIDICEEKLAKVFEENEIEYINHHAAQTSVIVSLEKPLYDARVNILGSLNLFEIACKYNVKKIIYASSGGACFGEPVYLPTNEDHPINPISPYGVSKHSVEHYLFFYFLRYGLDYTVLLYSNVYGPRQDPFGEGGVVAIFSNKMLKGDRPTIYGNGEQTRDFIYIDDVVEANICAMEKGSGERMNIGMGSQVSVNQIFEGIKSIAGYEGGPDYGKEREGEVRHIYMDIRKVAKVLGWRPRVSIEEGLEKTVEYFKKH